jgi:hypothetical protein
MFAGRHGKGRGRDWRVMRRKAVFCRAAASAPDASCPHTTPSIAISSNGLRTRAHSVKGIPHQSVSEWVLHDIGMRAEHAERVR